MSLSKPTLPAIQLGVHDGPVRLEDLIDRAALVELCESFRSLFGIAVRVFSSEGTVLADLSSQHEICAFVGTSAQGRAACGRTVGAVKVIEPKGDAMVVHPCFTGNAYRVAPIDYDGRRIGRVVLGPFLPAETDWVPSALSDVDPALDAEHARRLLAKVPRAKGDTITRLVRHLRASLDLILFSGHKTLLTSQMHLASVRESYRQLEDKGAALQEAFDKLKALDRLKSNFLATVSHELRTPLTSVIGYSEMLADGIAGPLTPQQADFVATISEKSQQLLTLIQSLLDLSKLESGTLTFRSERVRVGEVIDDVLKTMIPAARKRSVGLLTECEPDLPEVAGDAERLRQVLTNLCDNALKFTPDGGSITIGSRVLPAAVTDDDDGGGFALLAPLRARIEVRVIDTGLGIAASEREKVFDAFYQVDSSSTRQYEGAGLGLSIVKRIVDAHGGNIRIESNTPRGTAFVLELPAAHA
jgi:hypothetical protein